MAKFINVIISEYARMSKSDLLKNMVEQLSSLLPEQFTAFKKDFEKNCHSILSNTFSKLDLVTREEFDVQAKVLSRTRQKLEVLEKQLQTLELTMLQQKNHSDDKKE